MTLTQIVVVMFAVMCVCVLLIEVARTVTSLFLCNSVGVQLVRKEKKLRKL